MTDPTHLDRLPFLPFLDPRMVHTPGVQPLDPAEWLQRDAAFAAQMALRDRLIAERREDVFRLRPEGEAAAAELLEAVLAFLRGRDGYRFAPDRVTRPDGVTVVLAADAPLVTAGRLVQEDFCLMQRAAPEGEHALTGGLLCFPSRWTLSEKMARGLLGIHAPVPFYAEGLAARVQRLFDAIRPGRPLWRANWLVHHEPELHQPKREATKSPRRFDLPDLFVRVERQTLLRLPGTGAVVFGIKTDVAPLASLSAAEGRGLAAAIRGVPEPEYSYKGGDVLVARLEGVFGAGQERAEAGNPSG